jgi:hypothetical protein
MLAKLYLIYMSECIFARPILHKRTHYSNFSASFRLTKKLKPMRTGKCHNLTQERPGQINPGVDYIEPLYYKPIYIELIYIVHHRK